MPPTVRTVSRFACGLIAASAVIAGCWGQTDLSPRSSTPQPATPRAAVTLRVAIVSDEPLRRTLDRLRGEWNALTDGDYETFAVATAGAGVDADVLVFPSRAMGELCEADALRPVRRSVLESETLRFDDLLPLVRDHEVVYAQQAMALPLGCPTPLMLGGAASVPPPADDTELALAYLAWAAPYAVHSSRVATLFDADTFRPRLDAPPFVRSLQSFVDAAEDAGSAKVVWPNRESPLAAEAVEISPMPGASESYNDLADAWEPLSSGESRATLLASSGRLIGVTKASRNAATAFRLAAWLAGPENGRLVSTSSDGVAICRGSFARVSDAWRRTDDREVAKRFSAGLVTALRQGRYVLAPRLPGADEYLENLGSHVREALEGRPAAAALADAVADWETISEGRGRPAQRAAYERSINVAGPALDD